MLAIIWETCLSLASFLGASVVWLFGRPAPPDFSQVPIMLASVLFTSVGLYFACRVCRTGRGPYLWLTLGFVTTQGCVLYYVFTTPFFKI